MKWFPRILLLFLVPALQAQDIGRAQGFPADPVISAAYEGDLLYLGTQGSGVYELLDGYIRPSARFKKFNRSSIFSFSVSDSGLVPEVQGALQDYPLVVTNDDATKYIITADGVQIVYSDAATQISDKASGIWRMTLGFERLNFLRIGSELVTLDATGYELNRQNFKGLIFDLGPTDYGLLLSTEDGYYQWNNAGHKWKKVGSGMPIFAFDGAKARTPLGHIALNKLLEGSWTMDDFEPMPERQTHPTYYDVDTADELYYGAYADGIDVFNEDGIQYTLGMARGLPAFRPGNYDIALIGNDLWVATPMGLWKFNNKGVPNFLRHLHIDFTANGLTIPSFDDLEVEPASIGFTTTHKKSSSAPIHGRYRINNDPWNSFTPGEPVLFVRPAPGNYTLDIQTSHRLDFEQGMNAHYEYRISAWWYKRPIFWSVAIVIIAAGLWYRQRQAKIRIQEKLELQERLADAELASKRLQMNPHFLFNALDAISNFIFKNQPKDAVQYMGKLAKMMRLTLDSSRSTSMVVADEKELIEKYLDLCILRYGTFNAVVEVDDDLDPYDYKVPPMLIQPLVENAVQHGIRPLLAEGKEGSIRVQFSLQGPSVQITITDNGPGFDPAQKASKSHGLAIIEERLHLLSKKYGGEFSLRCSRLGEEHSPDGMQVSLILTMENDG
jgi:hypothetical protein